SKIDIAETRVPQDGRFRMKIDGKNLEFRVSTFPTIYGESIVLRILNRENIMMGLEETGLCGETLDDFKKSILKRQGIIIVTGPTGSGKTTTLYSCLNMLNSPEKTIVTIEDPVEYRLRYVRQTQINPKGGLTFARGLRSILRQDPDVIMVGEIRDAETAQIATRAAMTGHLVLSTMHTGASIDVIARLKDLGMETCLIVSTLKGVLAQRLVRKICAKCGTKNSGLDTQLSGLPMAAEKTAAYGQSECVRCKSSGYFGRIGIFEFLRIDDQIQDMVVKGERPSSIRRFALQSGLLTTMRDDGLSKVKSGVTTLEEVEKATCEN
ncbi:Type IV fimbrial assembly, ATPase PilB, partial [hydrothermal vent metagenome]